MASTLVHGAPGVRVTAILLDAKGDIIAQPPAGAVFTWSVDSPEAPSFTVAPSGQGTAAQLTSVQSQGRTGTLSLKVAVPGAADVTGSLPIVQPQPAVEAPVIASVGFAVMQSGT